MIAKVVRGLRRHWLRLLIGGGAMWLLAIGFWLLAFVYLESQHIAYDDYTVSQIVYVTLVVSWPLGALWAWVRK